MSPEIDLFEDNAPKDDRPSDVDLFEGTSSDPDLVQSYEQAVRTSPDELAETLKLSKQTGYSPDLVQRNRDEVRRRAEYDPGFVDQFNEAPEAKDWAKDPNNLGLIHDAPGYISDIKQTVKGVWKGIGASKSQLDLIDIRKKQLYGTALTPEEETLAQSLSKEANQPLGTGGAFSTVLTEAARSSLPGLKVGVKGAVGAAGGAAVGTGAALSLNLIPGVALLPEELITVPSLAGKGARVGYKIGSTKENFEQQASLIFDDLLNTKDLDGKAMDTDLARGAAVAAGIPSALLDQIAFDKILKTVPIPYIDKIGKYLSRDGIKTAMKVPGMREAFTRIGKQWVTSSATEGVTEAAQQAIQIIAQEVAKAENDGRYKDFSWSDAAKEVGSAGAIGFGVGGVYSTPGSAMQASHAYRNRDITTPEEVAAYAQNMNQKVRGDILFQRNQDAFHSLVSSLSGDDRMYMSAEPMMEALSGMTEEQRQALFTAVPELEIEVQNAMQTGADVAIKKADYATFIAPHPQADLLVPHIKLDPADQSLAERQAMQEAIKAAPEMAAEIQRELGTAKPVSPQEMYSGVQRIVSKAMQGVGRSRQEAEMVGSLFARTISRFVAPFGQNAVDLMTQNVLQFQALDENNQPVLKRSNVDVLLDDLDATNAGRPPRGTDDQYRTALQSFKQRLDDAGVTPEMARKLPHDDLMDRLYPKEDATADDAKKDITTFLEQRRQAEAPQTDAVDTAQGAQMVEGAKQFFQLGVAQRNNLGLYSAVEREVINMNLPQWKPAAKPAMTPEMTAELEMLMKEVTSTKDERYPRRVELAEIQRKDQGLAKGKDIWQKIEKLPVKKEEMEWLGLEEYLTSVPENTYTREDVVTFIRENGVKIEEVVADQEYTEKEFDWREERDEYDGFDDDYYREQIAPGESYENRYDEIVDGIVEDEERYIDENFDGDKEDAAAVRAWVIDNFADAIERKVDDLAREMGEEAYNENPYVRYYDRELDYEIHGNDDIGYTITTPEGKTLGGDIYSFSEAEIQALQHARDYGHMTSDDDPNVARHEAHLDGSYSEYRERKFTLPNNPGEEFVEAGHFNDPNIVAFTRETDRVLPSKIPDDVDIDAEVENVTSDRLDDETGDFGKKAEDQAYENSRNAVLESYKYAGIEPDEERMSDYTAWENIVIGNFAQAEKIADEAYELARGRRGVDGDAEYQVSVTADAFDKIYRERRRIEIAAGEYRKFQQEKRYHLNDIEKQNTKQGKVARSRFASQNAFFIDEFQSDWHQAGRKEGYKLDLEDAGELEDQGRILTDKAVERHAQVLADNPVIEKKINDLIDEAIIKTKAEADRLISTENYNDISTNSNRDGVVTNIEAYRTNTFRLIEQFLKGEHKAQDDGSFTMHFNKDFEAFPDADVKAFLKEYQAAGGKEVINYMKAAKDARDQAHAERYGVPNVPWKDDAWIALGLKRALVDAVEKGYKRFAWADAEVVVARWSERYRTLYETQYDNKMPGVIRRITGIEPIHVEDADVMGRHHDGGYWYIDITPELEAKVKNEGFTLFQRANGWINFEEGLKKVTIAFTQGANLSTAAHEMAHFGVAMHRQAVDLARMAKTAAESQGNEVAPEIQRIIDDWDALKKAVGAKDDTFTVEQEEKAARLFEAYLREGKAPSEALRRTFARFRDWMTSIYKDVRQLLGDDELNDEVRGVFDRWLASDAEIEEVQGKNDALAQMAQNFGLDSSIIDKVADYVNSATMEAEDRLYRELDAEQKKRETDAYKRELDDMKKIVGDEFLQRREYGVQKYMEELGFKFLDGYGMEGVPEKLLTQEDSETTVMPDDVADLFGYGSGQELIRAIKSVPDFDRAVDREARKRLMTKYPDMIAQGRIQNKAVEAIQNDKVLLAIDLMIKELGKAAGVTPVNMKQFAKVIAQRQVLDSKQAEANYSFRYDIARDKAMREALKASRAGDHRKAMIELQKSMVNQIVYKQLEDFKEFKDKAQQLFAKVNGKDKNLAGGRDIDFLGSARYILSKFGLGQTDPSFDVQQWMADLNERNPDIAQDILGLTQLVATNPKPADQLTIGEYTDIYNAIENIYKVARTAREITIAGRKMKIEQAVQEATANIDIDKIPLNASTQVIGINKFKQNISTGKAALRRIENWSVAMDGEKNGPMWRYVWKPINDAVDTYIHERNRWNKRLRSILKKNEKRLSERRKVDSGMFKKDSLGRVVPLVWNDRMEMIGFLLHTGNESNLDKLLGGYGIEPSAWETAKQELERTGSITEEDWKMVQDMWDMAEDLKPISQKAHKDLFGYRFDEIEPLPVRTQYGTFRGGYWPAVVDTDQTTEGKTQEQLLEQSRQYIIATTGRGFTKSRVQGYKQPLKTDIRLASQHVDKVLRFSYLEPAVRNVNRIVNNRDFKAKIAAVDPSAVTDMLQPWLSRVATQTVTPIAVDRSARMGSKMINFAARNSALQLMGYNLVVAVQNVANIPAAMHQAGFRNVGSAFVKYMMNPIGLRQDMLASSKMMQARLTTNDEKLAQEIEQIADRAGKLRKGRDAVVRHSRIFMLAVDNVITPAIWTGAYNKATKMGMSDIDASSYADQVIRETQSASNAKDISRLEASSAVVKALMPFYNFFGSQANLITTEFGNIMRKDGWSGSGKMFMAYVSLVAAPAFVGQVIADAMRGRLPEDDDDDGQVLDDWIAYFIKSQVFYLTAMAPIFGQAINAAINTFDDKPLNDRISISPAVSTIEGVYRGVKNVWKATEGDDINDGRLISDAASGLGFFTGVPLGQPARPAAYGAAVMEGRVAADDPYQVMTGILTGRTTDR